jgi:hypothetical protein
MVSWHSRIQGETSIRFRPPEADLSDEEFSWSSVALTLNSRKGEHASFMALRMCFP